MCFRSAEARTQSALQPSPEGCGWLAGAEGTVSRAPGCGGVGGSVRAGALGCGFSPGTWGGRR